MTAEDEVVADEIISGVKIRIKQGPSIWSTEVRPGFMLDLHQDGSYYDWVLRTNGRVVGGGSLRRTNLTKETLVEESGIYEEWQGKKLYQGVLRALSGYFGQICTRELETVSPAAKKAWKSAGAVEDLMRYCLRARRTA